LSKLAMPTKQLRSSKQGRTFVKLAHYGRGEWPPIKIIATSGQMTLCDADLPEGGIFLPQPYAPEAISATLHTLTGS
jgi:two-component system, response regulator PdtaR